MCPGAEWRTWQSPNAMSRAFGEFKDKQRCLWGVSRIQPLGKARGWPFRNQLADPKPCPPPLRETLRFTEKSLQGFGSLIQGWYLNRKKESGGGGYYTKPVPPPGEFSWLPVGGREPRGVLERGGWALGWLEAAEQREAASVGHGESQRGGRFLSFTIPVSPSGLPTRSHDPSGRGWVFYQPPRGRQSYRQPSHHLLPTYDTKDLPGAAPACCRRR